MVSSAWKRAASDGSIKAIQHPLVSAIARPLALPKARAGVGSVDQPDGLAAALSAFQLRPDVPFHSRRVWPVSIAQPHQIQRL